MDCTEGTELALAVSGCLSYLKTHPQSQKKRLRENAGNGCCLFQADSRFCHKSKFSKESIHFD